jgi:hypothetical protein
MSRVLLDTKLFGAAEPVGPLQRKKNPIPDVKRTSVAQPMVRHFQNWPIPLLYVETFLIYLGNYLVQDILSLGQDMKPGSPENEIQTLKYAITLVSDRWKEPVFGL